MLYSFLFYFGYFIIAFACYCFDLPIALLGKKALLSLEFLLPRFYSLLDILFSLIESVLQLNYFLFFNYIAVLDLLNFSNDKLFLFLFIQSAKLFVCEPIYQSFIQESAFLLYFLCNFDEVFAKSFFNVFHVLLMSIIKCLYLLLSFLFYSFHFFCKFLFEFVDFC